MTNWQSRHKVVPAVYVIFERAGKILLAKRANTGYMDGMYGLPAGHLDGGESAAAAAVRECEEEVGMHLEPRQLEMVHMMHRLAEEGDHERIDIFFTATEFTGEPENREPQKCDELRWAPYDDLPENIIPEVKHVFEQIKAGKTYSEYNFS